VVKDVLRDVGIAVPDHVVERDPSALGRAVSGLEGPLVVKAFGPGILHKSELGAVAMSVEPARVDAVATEMAAHLDGLGVVPAGFLAERQAPAGSELIVGAVRRDPFGVLALLGVGGVLTELADRSALRPCPLGAQDIRELIDTLPDTIRRGLRGAPPVDALAAADLLARLAGPGGLVERLGEALVELECNPVIAGPDGMIAVDARLVVRPGATPVPRLGATDFSRLFAPRAIAVAGASRDRETFGNRFLAAYRDAGWTDGLYAVHPDADAIDGVPAVPSVHEVPGGVDYLLVAVPAARAIELVDASVGAARFTQVVSGGFREAGADGTVREAELVAAAGRATTRLLGPNCMGVFSPAGRQTFLLDSPRDAGTVSVVSQSGGLAGDIIQVGARRGVSFAKLATIGNGADVSAGELLAWLVDDDSTAVIGVYVEGVRDPYFLDALRRAAGRTPVVVLPGGLSQQGAVAVVSHTGSMAGDARVWDGVARATGATVVATLEDLVGTLAYLQHHRDRIGAHPAGTLIVGPGGGAAVLATDACDRAGVPVTPVGDELRHQLRELGYGAGTSVRNPIEIPVGPAAPPDAFDRLLDPLLDAQHYSDVLLHVNVQSFASFGHDGCAPLLELLARVGEIDRSPTRLALVLRNLECASAEEIGLLHQTCDTLGLPLLRDFDEAATAIAAAQRFDSAAVASG
jgi:acyl-CoA synthetase (NDP forming)